MVVSLKRKHWLAFLMEKEILSTMHSDPSGSLESLLLNDEEKQMF
jgi:hypothetical protein